MTVFFHCIVDIHFVAHIGDRLNVRQRRHIRMSIRPWGIHFDERIGDTRDDHIWLHTNKFFHPRDIHSHAHIGDTRDDHYKPPPNKLRCPKDIHFDEALEDIPSNLYWLQLHNFLVNLPDGHDVDDVVEQPIEGVRHHCPR